MEVFAIIGAGVVTVFALAIGAVLLTIAGNIYGGIKGAYRIRRVKGINLSHMAAIRLGLACWYGRRFCNGVGEYWQVNGLIVPVDGRDPVRRDQYSRW